MRKLINILLSASALAMPMPADAGSIRKIPMPVQTPKTFVDGYAVVPREVYEPVLRFDKDGKKLPMRKRIVYERIPNNEFKADVPQFKGAIRYSTMPYNGISVSDSQ